MITVRTSETVEGLLQSVFATKTKGAATVLDAWQYLRKNTLNELKGKFTEQELYALIDAHNGLIFEPKFARAELIKIEIEDTIKYSQFSQNWDFNEDEFFAKIESLSSAQAYFLLEEIQRFWNKLSAEENSLDEFVKRFI